MARPTAAPAAAQQVALHRRSTLWPHNLQKVDHRDTFANGLWCETVSEWTCDELRTDLSFALFFAVSAYGVAVVVVVLLRSLLVLLLLSFNWLTCNIIRNASTTISLAKIIPLRFRQSSKTHSGCVDLSFIKLIYVGVGHGPSKLTTKRGIFKNEVTLPM